MPTTKKRTFRRFTYQTRLKLEALYNAGVPIKRIEDELHFHNSSIYRELRLGMYDHKNTDWTYTKKYSATLAEQKSHFNTAARAKDLKVGADMKFVRCIEELILKRKYSPAAALAYIKRHHMNFDTDVSVRTIYRYIDHGVFLHLTRKDLPFKGKRKRIIRKTIVPKRACMGTSIEQRPIGVLSRVDFGHWELDSVIGRRCKGNTLLVLTERKTRKELVFRSKDKTAFSTVSMLNSLERMLGKDFKKVFKTITCDNGCEFSSPTAIEKSCLDAGARTKVYYCHPFSSWERGSNEKQNQMLRRWIYKSTRIEEYSDDQIKAAEEWLNNYPRAMFDWQTSQELFEQELHKIGVKKIF